MDAWTDWYVKVSHCAHLCPCPSRMTERLHGVPSGLETRKWKFDGKQRESQFKGSNVLAELLSAIRLVTFRQWGNDCVDMMHQLYSTKWIRTYVWITPSSTTKLASTSKLLYF